MQAARGFVSMTEVVGALILRETRTRFGAHQLGYLWAFLEPILMILTFYIVFEVAGRHVPHGMDPITFLATGILPYQLFASSANRISQAIRGNKALLFYPHVQPLDLVIARSLLEAVTYAGVFLVIVGTHTLNAQAFEIDSALWTIGGFAMAAGLGSALGLLFCTLDQFSQVVDRTRGTLLRPLFWTSGIFFAATELPQGVREVLLYNPLLQCVELIRDGWFTTYDVDFVDAPYVMAWILAMALIGLTLERVVRRRIELT